MLRVEVRMIEREGLFLVDVDADAGDAAFIDGTDEVRFHGDAAAAGVHHEGGGLHLAEAGIVDEAGGALVVGGVDADDIGSGQQFVQGDAGVVLAVPGAGGGVVDDLHAEGCADGGDFLADGAHPHDAEGLAVDFGEGVVRIDMDAAGAVAAVPRVGVVVEGEPEEVEDVHPGDLGDGLRGIPGDVPDDDAPFGAEVCVDVVDSRARFADEPDLRTGVEKGLIDNDFIQDDHVGVGRAEAGFFGRGGGVADEFAQGGDLRHRCVAHGGGVQENDLHITSVDSAI